MWHYSTIKAKGKEQRPKGDAAGLHVSVSSRLRVFIALCSMLLALCFLVASAQEVKVSVKKARVKVDSVKDEASSTKANDDLNAEDRDVDAGGQDRSARKRRFRRFQQDGRARGRPGEMLPPEARKIMEEEGISREDLKDPEVVRKLREKVERMRREEARKVMEEENISQEDLERDPEIRRRFRERMERMRRERGSGGAGRDARAPGGDSAEESRRMRRGRRGEPADEGLKRYVDIVVKKNLFLRLGSGGEEKKTSFALTAVMSNTSNGPDSKAIIEEMGGGRSYYVSEGDAFADEVEVVDIDEQVVKLDRSGEGMTLKLGEGTSSGRRGGGGRRGGRSSSGRGERRPSGGGGRPRSSPSRGGRGGFNPSQIPEPVRRMMKERGISFEELRNNPELQEQFRREMRERSRRDGDGRRPQNHRLEMRSRDRDRRPRGRR